jgi:hypothetical protein
MRFVPETYGSSLLVRTLIHGGSCASSPTMTTFFKDDENRDRRRFRNVRCLVYNDRVEHCMFKGRCQNRIPNSTETTVEREDA